MLAGHLACPAAAGYSPGGQLWPTPCWFQALVTLGPLAPQLPVLGPETPGPQPTGRVVLSPDLLEALLSWVHVQPQVRWTHGQVRRDTTSPMCPSAQNPLLGSQAASLLPAEQVLCHRNYVLPLCFLLVQGHRLWETRCLLCHLLTVHPPPPTRSLSPLLQGWRRGGRRDSAPLRRWAA